MLEQETSFMCNPSSFQDFLYCYTEKQISSVFLLSKTLLLW